MVRSTGVDRVTVSVDTPTRPNALAFLFGSAKAGGRRKPDFRALAEDTLSPVSA